ncbi:hypothetical protein N7516_003342 [Penicillium verrucosum]|uniref:uncharacterized protein n=1 Tax=Penicillium verrucosum TaxID=60171 RepID=UPI0025457588|nr:uncharacterized protein N7516_003342 [Penicillium verrucosum]KAJ5943174.1 hypothetical protein N7516_003342 [Penicillium verrucosum]
MNSSSKRALESLEHSKAKCLHPFQPLIENREIAPLNLNLPLVQKSLPSPIPRNMFTQVLNTDEPKPTLTNWLMPTVEFNPRISNPKDTDGASNTVNVNWPLPYTRSIGPFNENGFAVVTQTWYDYSSITDSDSQSSESLGSFCFDPRSSPVPRICTRV